MTSNHECPYCNKSQGSTMNTRHETTMNTHTIQQVTPPSASPNIDIHASTLNGPVNITINGAILNVAWWRRIWLALRVIFTPDLVVSYTSITVTDNTFNVYANNMPTKDGMTTAICGTYNDNGKELRGVAVSIEKTYKT